MTTSSMTTSVDQNICIPNGTLLPVLFAYVLIHFGFISSIIHLNSHLLVSFLFLILKAIKMIVMPLDVIEEFE